MAQTLASNETKSGQLTNRPILMVINADTSVQEVPPANRTKERLADFAALRQVLEGDVLDWNDVKRSRFASLLSMVGGKGIALSALAFARRKRYSLFYCDSENNGLVLAALLKFSRTRVPLLMIGHWITPAKKAILIKGLRLQTVITTLFVHSSSQYEAAVEKLGFRPNQVQLLPYQVDTDFWQPKNSNPERYALDDKPYICAAGLEFRDYRALVEAVQGLDLQLKIGASSHWSKRKNSLSGLNLPPNVQVGSFNYEELRDLIGGCLCVVVPLYDVNFQAGITAILEAMAMGKTVVVTRSKGQSDTVVDSRRFLRDNPSRATSGTFHILFKEVASKPGEGQTGYYASPGKPEELRKVLKHLLDHPEEAAKVGAQARHSVESLMSVEQFARRIRQAILETISTRP